MLTPSYTSIPNRYTVLQKSSQFLLLTCRLWSRWCHPFRRTESHCSPSHTTLAPPDWGGNRERDKVRERESKFGGSDNPGHHRCAALRANLPLPGYDTLHVPQQTRVQRQRGALRCRRFRKLCGYRIPLGWHLATLTLIYTAAAISSGTIRRRIDCDGSWKYWFSILFCSPLSFSPTLCKRSVALSSAASSLEIHLLVKYCNASRINTLEIALIPVVVCAVCTFCW